MVGGTGGPRCLRLHTIESKYPADRQSHCGSFVVAGFALVVLATAKAASFILGPWAALKLETLQPLAGEE